MVQRYSENSFVRAAIEYLSGHAQDRTMFERLLPANDGGCPWRTSEEDHWVAHFASVLLDCSREFRPRLQFNQVFEKPSHGSEKKKQGGYDLSFGPYDRDSYRIRSMHKVVKGKWCDAYWTWTADADDMGHVEAILSNEGHLSLLVVNVFYCIHDWRRLGENVADQGGNLTGFVVPDFSSHLRTVIVNLSSARELVLGSGVTLTVGCRGVRKPVATVEEWQETTMAAAFVYAEANGKPLPILRVADVLEQTKIAWISKKLWAPSNVK